MVPIGKIDDTVVPEIKILAPVDKDILTTAEPLRTIIAIEDIGYEDERQVFIEWYREHQSITGEWVVDDYYEQTVFRDDFREVGDNTPISDPEAHYYIYWGDFTEGNILRRTDQRNERVRVIARVVTRDHTIETQAVFEVGLRTSERRFIAPTVGSQKSAFYTNIDQYRGDDREGAMVVSWSTQNPLFMEQGIGVIPDPGEGAKLDPLSAAFTGIYIMDQVDELESDEEGSFYAYSPLLNGAAEIFVGND